MFNLFNHDNTDFINILNMAGHDILINGEPSRAVITNPKLNVILDYDDRYINTLSTIKCGDNITWNNTNYLIIADVEQKRHNKYRSIMRNVNYSVKFVLNGALYEFDTIIDSKTLDVRNSVITFPTGKVLVTMQENEDTLKIKLGQRFIKMGSAWKVAGIDRSKRGLITLTCDIDTINQFTDDMENEIADVDQLITYTLEITNTNTTIQEGNLLQLNVVVKKNDNVVTENVIYQSSDSSIASVNSNGLVTAHEVGNVTITARLEIYPDVFDTIQLEVEEVDLEKTIIIIGEDEIFYYDEETYIAKVYEGTNEIVEDVTWSITSGSQYVTVLSQNGSSITLEAKSSTGNVTLVATLVSDNSVVDEKQIRVKSLW